MAKETRKPKRRGLGPLLRDAMAEETYYQSVYTGLLDDDLYPDVVEDDDEDDFGFPMGTDTK